MARPAKQTDADLELLRRKFAVDPSRAAELAAEAGYALPYFMRMVKGYVHASAGGPIAPRDRKKISILERRKIFADAIEALHLTGEVPTLVAVNPQDTYPKKAQALRIRRILERTQEIITTLWANTVKRGDDECWAWKGRWRRRRTGPLIPVIIGIDSRNYVDARKLWAQTRGRLYPKRGKLHMSCSNACINPGHILNATRGQRGH